MNDKAANPIILQMQTGYEKSRGKKAQITEYSTAIQQCFQQLGAERIGVYGLLSRKTAKTTAAIFLVTCPIIFMYFIPSADFFS